MTNESEPRRPTDHLPPREERAADDDRTTADADHPVDPPAGESGVNPDTAAEPEKPARHGVANLPPGMG